MGSPSSDSPVTPFPERIGRYELLLPIGTGGMATVFLGRMSGVGGFERDVAVKIIHAHLRADEDSKNHLLEEARLAARIRHPNVVPVLEVGDDAFGVYLVMDYVEGDSLAGLMRDIKATGERLPLPFVARILSDALSGLHAAHELVDESGRSLGLVHRDFSPQNILVGIDGVSRLADFSVAKAADRAVRTRTGLVKGKISYMSPEQARGHAVDRRCDVWAAGVVTWELIAWRRLHRQGDAVSTLLSVVTEEPPKLSTLVPDVPKALEDIVARALSMDPAGRIPSAIELRQELEDAFRSVGPIADTHEVGELVRKVLGPQLRERQERVAEIRKLRRRMGEIAGPSPVGADESPPAFEMGPPLEGELTRIDRPSAFASRLGGGVPLRTEDLDVPLAVATPYPPRKRWPRLGIAGAAVVLGAGLATAALWTSTLGSKVVGPDAPPVSGVKGVGPALRGATNAAAGPEALPGRSTAPPSVAEEAPRAPVAAVPSGEPVPSVASRPNTRRPAPSPPPSVRFAAPRSKPPTKLAQDPYEGAR
jgi:hypothetical protein